MANVQVLGVNLGQSEVAEAFLNGSIPDRQQHG
jgi:hypothetical protein